MLDIYLFELLVLFWLTQVDIYFFKFISHYIKEILYVNTNFIGNQSWNKNKEISIFTCLRYGAVQLLCHAKISPFWPTHFPTITLRYEWSQDPPYVTSRLTQMPPLSFVSHFWNWKKKQRYAPTHDTSTHVFKQLNQIVRFK